MKRYEGEREESFLARWDRDPCSFGDHRRHEYLFTEYDAGYAKRGLVDWYECVSCGGSHPEPASLWHRFVWLSQMGVEKLSERVKQHTKASD